MALSALSGPMPPFGRRHPDDRELGALDADGLPDGIGATVGRVAEEVGGHLGAEHGHPGGALHLLVGEEGAARRSVTFRTVW